jgi:hypothetical protein
MTGSAGPEPRRDPAVLAIAAGVGLLCAGMALAIGGVVVPGLFLPGAIIIALGILACGAAAVLRLLAAPADEAASAPRG